MFKRFFVLSQFAERVAKCMVCPTNIDVILTQSCSTNFQGAVIQRRSFRELLALQEIASKSIKPREKGRSNGPYKRRVAKGFIVETLSKLRES